MKLKDLKVKVDSLTDEQLGRELIVKGRFSTEVVEEIEFTKEDLYWNGDDDPCELMTESEMRDNMDEDDEMPEPMIKKGELLLVTY